MIADRAAAEDFVRFFGEGWAKPKPDGFLDHFRPRFHPDAYLEQPTLPPATGLAEIEERFRELFALFPDYLVTVDDWAERGDVVWIGVTHSATYWPSHRELARRRPDRPRGRAPARADRLFRLRRDPSPRPARPAHLVHAPALEPTDEETRMTQKADFNAEEWSLVLEGPPVAGMIVIMSQRGGTLRESLSLGKAYAEAREAHGNSELLDAIVADHPEMDAKKYGSMDALREEGLAKVREAVELLEEKATPDEVDEYKKFIVGLAERAAHAHKSGGLSGIGGEEVSYVERAAMDEINAALDSPGQEHASAG